MLVFMLNSSFFALKLINKLIDLQGFFNKIIVRFSFINIFAFC